MSPRLSGESHEEANRKHAEMYQAFISGTGIPQLSENYGLHPRSVERIIRKQKFKQDLEFKRRMKKK